MLVKHKVLGEHQTILSTGIGRIHFIETATALQAAGEEVRLITGWVPTGNNDWLVDAAGRIVGRPNLSDRLAVRRANGAISPDRIHSCTLAEAAGSLFHHFLRDTGRARPAAMRLAWKLFGFSSRRFLRDAHIFHVRSGAGQGGAISTARGRGMKCIADHSIAHPDFMAKALNPVLERYRLTPFAGTQDPFWDLVIQDCKDADTILVNSGFVKDTFVENGFPAERIQVAYLGVRRDFLSLKTDYASNATTRLLFTGGFTARKGAGDLLDALRAVNNGGCRCELTVVGSMAESAPVLAVHGSQHSARFAGVLLQDELKSYLRNADIYVFPTLAEGCAKSAMEALAAGLPVITTRECGLPVEHMKHAYIIPSNSPERLAEAIHKLATDESLRAQLGRAGAELVRARYSWEEYGRSLQAIHSSLLGK
jgi:glycosyltransferase involved in cell wall biosynthesis